MTGPDISSTGTKRWYNDNGKLHRTDGPAIEYLSGQKQWHHNGLLHRVDGPAVEWADGGETWYLNGLMHRADGPAYEGTNGIKEWWLNGVEVEQFEVTGSFTYDEMVKMGWALGMTSEWGKTYKPIGSLPLLSELMEFVAPFSPSEVRVGGGFLLVSSTPEHQAHFAVLRAADFEAFQNKKRDAAIELLVKRGYTVIDSRLLIEETKCH